MAGAQAPHDHVEGVGKLGAEPLLPPPAQDAQDQIGQNDAAEHGDQQRFEQIAAYDQTNGKRHHREQHVEQQQLLDAEREPGLQHELVDVDEAQAVVAARSEPALAPQLDEDIFAVGLVLEQLQAAIDVLAVGGAGKAQQVDSLDHQAGRGGNQDIDKIDRVEVESHGSDPYPRGNYHISR